MAFTRARARMEKRLPSSRSRCRCHSPLLLRALTQRVRVWICAPCSRAAMALSTTRRASSTQQSAYSKPWLISCFSGLSAPKRTLCEAPSFALAEVVVEEQAGADHPGRAQVRSVGQHETQWPNDVWRLGQRYLALGQRLAHQTQFVMLEVAQPAMYQLAAGRRRVLGQVAPARRGRLSGHDLRRLPQFPRR